MKLYFLYILCFFLTSVGFAQKESNYWYFGVNAGINFNSGTGAVDTDGRLTAFGGMASISDRDGNLLFYTAGTTVLNRNHEYMPSAHITNSSELLNGCTSTTQVALIVPHPGNGDEYFIFTLDCEARSNGLQYSVVDMTLDGGLGDVSIKNVPLRAPMTEKITAIRSDSFNGYWILAHDWDSNQFAAYRVTASGVDATPVISASGDIITGNVDNAAGQMKFSSDGTKVALATEGDVNTVQLFDFDSSTGIVSNARTVVDGVSASRIYGVEFSPSGNKLYVSDIDNGVFQYDLEAGDLTDIINSEFVVAVFPRNYASLQLGLDGKLYIANAGRTYISVIGNPEASTSLELEYVPEAIDLAGRSCQFGLPPFIQSFFSVGFQTENYCQGEATNFSLNTTQPYDTLQWDFGDGSFSTDENPTHIYNYSGEYEVTLTVTLGSETSNQTEFVTIYEQPIANSIADQIVCDDDNDLLEFYDLTQHASDILGSQDPSQFELTYYDGIFNYNNENPITDALQFELLTGSTANPVISIHNIDNPDCEDTVTFQIQVFEGANPSQSLQPITICDNTSFGTDTDGIVITDLTQREAEILNGQSATDFTVTYFTDAAFTNQITTPIAYQNTNTSETIYVLMENDNMAANCLADTTFQLEVLQLPTVTPIVNLSQCDDDTDGFSVFNLTEVYAELSANAQNETITFHESQLEAENNNSPITNVTTYTNETVSTDSVWARIESTNGCNRTAQVNLLVSTTQIPLNFTREFYTCDDAVNGTTTDGISAFDFSAVTSEIEAIFPVGQQLLINYYRNQADALAEENPIADISNYRNIGYPNTQDIYIRVDSALDNDCLGLGEHITLTVETIPVANAVIIAEQCDADGDGLYPFDTNTIEADILQGQPNIAISYSDAMGNPLPSPLPNPFLSGTQNVTARLTNTTSQDPNGACFAETTLSFRVQAAAVANPVADVVVCDDDTDGFFNFDTSTIETTLLNGQMGMTVSYTDAMGNLLPSPLPNPFFSNTQTITARVENVLSSTCFDETNIQFVVNEVPVANTIENDFVCDDASNDGEEFFTLSDYDSEVLGMQSDTTFEVFYFDSDVNAQFNISPLPSNYLVNSVSTTIHARIQNRQNSSCFAVTNFQLGVNILPIAATPTDLDVCDDELNDGEENFLLSDKDAEILNGLSPDDFDVKYYLSLDDANQDSNQVSDDFTNTESPQTIYVRLENDAATDCFTTTQFDIYVREQPVLFMDDLWPICEGGTLDIIADEGYDNYSWSNGEMTRIITVDAPQSLTVRAWNDYGSLICETEKTITVTQSNSATITNIETVDWTQTDNSITVSVTGNGDYEYSIDGIIYQDSNVFSNLVVDEYTVYVRDKLGCGTVTETVFLLGAPRFFTPNGDGNHDTWQIINGFTERNNVIRIFDRYGKLLKQLSPTDSGWDGTFNGNMLPTSDYWFVVERQNGKTYTGHFTLKR